MSSSDPFKFPVLKYSLCESRRICTCVSDLNDLCYHVNQVENALTKMMQSLTGLIAKFESLVNGMSCSNDAKSKQIGTDLPHVFVWSSQSEDRVEKLYSKDSPQNVDKRVDPVDPALLFARMKCI